MAGNEPVAIVRSYQSTNAGTGEVEYVASDGNVYHRTQPFEKQTHWYDPNTGEMRAKEG